MNAIEYFDKQLTDANDEILVLKYDITILKNKLKAKERIIELLNIENDMREWRKNNSYEYENIIGSGVFRNTKQLLSIDNYYTKDLVSLIEKYGYNEINNYFVDKVEEEKDEKIDNQ